MNEETEAHLTPVLSLAQGHTISNQASVSCSLAPEVRVPPPQKLPLPGRALHVKGLTSAESIGRRKVEVDGRGDKWPVSILQTSKYCPPADDHHCD